MSAFRNCYFHKCSLRKSYISIFVINFSIPVFWIRNGKKDTILFVRIDFRLNLICSHFHIFKKLFSAFWRTKISEIFIFINFIAEIFFSCIKKNIWKGIWLFFWDKIVILPSCKKSAPRTCTGPRRGYAYICTVDARISAAGTWKHSFCE